MGTNGTHRSHARCHPYPIPQPVKRGWPHHLGLHPILFSKSIVGSFTSNKKDQWKCCEMGPTVFRPYPRSLVFAMTSFADVIAKAALSSQLFKDPECWSGQGLNPRPPPWQTSALPTELTRRFIGLLAYFFHSDSLAVNMTWSSMKDLLLLLLSSSLLF